MPRPRESTRTGVQNHKRFSRLKKIPDGLLVVANIVLVWVGVFYGHAEAGLVGGIALGLGYTLARYFLALFLARRLTKTYAVPTHRNAFLVNLEIVWWLMLTVATLSLMPSLKDRSCLH